MPREKEAVLRYKDLANGDLVELYPETRAHLVHGISEELYKQMEQYVNDHPVDAAVIRAAIDDYLETHGVTNYDDTVLRNLIDSILSGAEHFRGVVNTTSQNGAAISFEIKTYYDSYVRTLRMGTAGGGIIGLRDMENARWLLYADKDGKVFSTLNEITNSDGIVTAKKTNGAASYLGVQTDYGGGSTRSLYMATATNKGVGLRDVENAKWILVSTESGTVTTPATSDRRLKNDYGEIPESEAAILLHSAIPHKFSYKADKNDTIQYGVMAQDFVECLKENELGYRTFLTIEEKTEGNLIDDLYADEENVIYGIDYSKIVPLLHSGWLMHERKIEDLQDRIDRQQQEMDELKAKLEEVLAKI